MPSKLPLPKNTVDETGHVYGRLTVLEYAGREESQAIGGRGGPAVWRCLCECGKETLARGARLRTGRSVSCGCWRADHDVRQAARMQVPERRRKAIARKGGDAYKAAAAQKRK